MVDERLKLFLFQIKIHVLFKAMKTDLNQKKNVKSHVHQSRTAVSKKFTIHELINIFKA